MTWVYAIGLLILGLVLILLDVLLTPGIDFLGLLGGLTVFTGVALAYAKLGPGPAAIVGAVGILGAILLLRLVLRPRTWRRMVLESEISRASGYGAARPGQDLLVGQQGEALTPLRPAGRARFGEEVVDVVTEGGFIDPGERVEVIQVAGNRVVVHRLANRATSLRPEEG